MTRRLKPMDRLAIDIACILRDGNVLLAKDLPDIAEQLGYSLTAGTRIRGMISSGVFTSVTGEEIQTHYRLGREPDYYLSKQALCEYPQRVEENVARANEQLNQHEFDAIARALRFLRK